MRPTLRLNGHSTSWNVSIVDSHGLRIKATCLILSPWRHPLIKVFSAIVAIMLASCITPTAPEPVAIETPAVDVPAEEPPIVEPEPEPEPVPDPAPVVPVPNVRIYNSAWEIVQEGYVVQSRSVTTVQSYADYVEEYNATHLEDQMFIIEGEEIILIEDAPAADAYIVEPTTHDIIREYIDWPRADISERRELWRFQAMADGGVLYVDRVPPPPVPIVDERPAYEKYALYLIYTIDDTIKYEEHPETEAEYLDRRAVYLLQESADGGTTYVIAGRLYP